MPQTIMPPKLSLPLSAALRDALRKSAGLKGRELTDHIQRVLAEKMIEEGLLAGDEKRRLQASWRVVDRAVAKAQELCRAGKFSSAITLDAIRACMDDKSWVADYRLVVDDDIFKNGNWRKGPINREIGFRIRAGIGGVTVKGPNGKPALAKVLGEIIQSYTPMASFDPAAVEAT